MTGDSPQPAAEGKSGKEKMTMTVCKRQSAGSVRRWRRRIFNFAGVLGAFEVHEDVDALHLLGTDESGELPARAADAGAAADVQEDDDGVLQLRQQLEEMVDVQVLAGLGLGLMGGVEEGDFGEQDLGVLHVGVVEAGAGGGVAEVREHRDFEAILDLDALLAEGGDLGAGEGEVFGL